MHRIERRQPSPLPSPPNAAQRMPAPTADAPDGMGGAHVPPLRAAKPFVHAGALILDKPTTTLEQACRPSLPRLPPELLPPTLSDNDKSRLTALCRQGTVYAGNLYEGARPEDVAGIMEHVIAENPAFVRRLFLDLPEGLLDSSKTGAIETLVRTIVQNSPGWPASVRAEFLSTMGEVSRSPLRSMSPEQALDVLEVAIDCTPNAWATMLSGMPLRQMRDSGQLDSYVSRFADLISRLSAAHSTDFRHALSYADERHSIAPREDTETSLLTLVAAQLPRYMASRREAVSVWLHGDADSVVDRVLRSATSRLPKRLAKACRDVYPQLELLTATDRFTRGDPDAWAQVVAQFPNVPWLATFAQSFVDAPQKAAHANTAKVRCMGEFLLLAQYLNVDPERVAAAGRGFNILLNHHDPAQRHALIAAWVDTALAPHATKGNFEASIKLLDSLPNEKSKATIVQFAALITGNGALLESDRALRYLMRPQLLGDSVAMRNAVGSLLALSDSRPRQKQAFTALWQAIFASPNDVHMKSRLDQVQREAEDELMTCLADARAKGPNDATELKDRVQALRERLGTLNRVRDSHIELLSHRAAGPNAKRAQDARALFPDYAASLNRSMHQAEVVCDLAGSLQLAGAQALATKVRGMLALETVNGKSLSSLQGEIKKLRKAAGMFSGDAFILQGLADVVDALADNVAAKARLGAPSVNARIPDDLLARSSSNAAQGFTKAKQGAIDKFYAEDLAPAVEMRLSYTEMMSRMGNSPSADAVADLDALSQQLFDILPHMHSSEAAGKFVELLQTLRNHQNYLIFVSRLGLDSESTLDFLSGVQHALVAGTYDTDRLAGSTQMEAAMAGMKDGAAFAQAWQAGVSKPIAQGLRGFVAEDTGRFEDILNGGTEVDGSCQHVSYEGELNHGLLGRLEDASKRQLVIKDETGTQIARSMWRVLTDPAGKAYLHLDDTYIASQQITKAEARALLLDFAKERGQALGLSVVVNADHADDEASELPFKHLTSRGREMPDYFDVAQIGLTQHDVEIPASALQMLS